MYEIVIQRAVAKSFALPATVKFKKWVRTTLKNKLPSAEITIRVVDENEITELNATYRKKNRPTNVLSFPFDNPKEITDEIPILGDIVICAEVIKEEAKSQGKTEEAHWAHMVVHGTLHLLGYDHENDQDAEKMENEEIKILAKLGFKNPYQILEKGEHK